MPFHSKEYERKYMREYRAKKKAEKEAELKFLRGFYNQIKEDMERLGIKIPSRS